MNALAELKKRARPPANPANPANQERSWATDSQDSQDSQGVKAEKRVFPPAGAAEFLVSLKGERERLLAAAAAQHVDVDHVHRLHDLDVAACAVMDERQRATFLTMLAESAERYAGRVPLNDTAAIHCASCGPVWVHPSIARVLPVVGGWPRALGCPWCFVRKAGGTIPRPPVTCGDCRHVIHDTINPGAGAGACGAGNGTHYPMARHACADHQPGESTPNVPPIKRE